MLKFRLFGFIQNLLVILLKYLFNILYFSISYTVCFMTLYGRIQIRSSDPNLSIGSCESVVVKISFLFILASSKLMTL